MFTYIIRRVLLVLPTLLIVTVIIFISIRLVPGNVIEQMIVQGGGTLSKESQEITRMQIEQRLGLDVPVYVQYGRWLKGLFTQGDLGVSLWRDTPVTLEIFTRLPITFELGIFGLVTALIISFPIGIYSAIRQDSVGDYIGRSFAIACIAVPGFWLGTLVTVLPSIFLGWSPPIAPISLTQNPLGNLAQYAIPGVILGMGMAGLNMRYLRTTMLDVLRQDYIRSAWSKGLSERVVIIRHTLKNALIPVITIIGLQVPVLVGGAVIMEQIFNLPGMGRLLLDAAIARDYTIISGVTLVIAVAILFINLGIDLLYAYLDPRIRLK